MPAVAASEHAAPPPASDDGQYLRLDPFIIPIMSHEAVMRHLIITSTLELSSESDRLDVRAKMPLLRHAFNACLIQLVGIQRPDNSLPPVATVKGRLLDVAREVVGAGTVHDVLIESIYERRLR